MNEILPVSFDFDMSTRGIAGHVQLNDLAKNLSNINEYVLTPAFHYSKSTGQFVITGYGLVHLTNLPTIEKLREMSDLAVQAAAL